MPVRYQTPKMKIPQTQSCKRSPANAVLSHLQAKSRSEMRGCGTLDECPHAKECTKSYGQMHETINSRQSSSEVQQNNDTPTGVGLMKGSFICNGESARGFRRRAEIPCNPIPATQMHCPSRLGSHQAGIHNRPSRIQRPSSRRGRAAAEQPTYQGHGSQLRPGRGRHCSCRCRSGTRNRVRS